jgi:hypothetical protein
MATVAVPSMPGVEVVRESTRRFIAIGAIGGFLTILTIVLFVGWYKGATVDDTVKLLTTIGSVLGGVVGAIVGFYFQTKD